MTIFKKLFVIAGFGFFIDASAGEIGRVVLTSGSVNISGRQAKTNDRIILGDFLQAGKDGILYVKTIDDRLVILRPSNNADVISGNSSENPKKFGYQIVSRREATEHRNQKDLKQAHQNLRFNTPVAAIGIRG